MPDTITIIDDRTGKKVTVADRRRHLPVRPRCASSIPTLRMYDPAFLSTAACAPRHHLPRRRRRHPALPRLPDRAARRAVDLPRGGLPAAQRRAARHGAARRVDLRRHPPHVPPRERAQAVHGGLPLRRPPDGHARVRPRRAVDLLPRGQGHLRRRRPRQADPAAHRQDADAGRLLPPLQRRDADRLPRQRALATPATSST